MLTYKIYPYIYKACIQYSKMSFLFFPTWKEIDFYMVSFRTLLFRAKIKYNILFGVNTP